MSIHVGYPEPELEKQVILAAVPKIPETIVDKMLAVAGEIRRLFMGNGAEGGPELTVTMSTGRSSDGPPSV